MVRFITDDRPATALGNVRLQVIAAGPPRAATSSLQAAMERLGFAPCMHMAQIVPHAEKSQIMIDAILEKDKEKRQKLIRQLIQGHVSLCDFPVCFFMADLMDMYPDVKIILNQRDSGAVWAKSCSEGLGFLFTWKYWFVGRLFKTDRLWYHMNMVGEQWIKDKYNVSTIWSAEVHDKHYDMVREEAAKRGIEVLEFRPSQGWEPLCRYLGKDVPKEEFPRLNDANAIRIIKTVLVVRGLLGYAAVGTTLWASWRFGPSALELLQRYFTGR